MIFSNCCWRITPTGGTNTAASGVRMGRSMNSQQAREKLFGELVELAKAAPTQEVALPALKAADAYALAVRRAVIDEILKNGYSREQMEDMRRNGIECGE